MSALTIALPAGRLARESVAFFQKAGIAQFDWPASDRVLSFYDRSRAFRIILVRSQDVPVYVLRGGADAGVAGRDVLAENRYDLAVALALNFGYCRLCVAALDSSVLKRRHLRVATKYASLAQDYFFKKGISCEIIKLHGSIEIAPALDLADCIVDLVSTGSTLRENQLLELETIMESQAELVVNRSAYALKTRDLKLMLLRLQAAA